MADRLNADTAIFALVRAPILLAVGAFSWIALATIVVLILDHRKFERQTQVVESVCAALGLAPSAADRGGRYYSGALDGRLVTIVFSPGPTLNIQVKTPLRTYASIGERDELKRLVMQMKIGKCR